MPEIACIETALPPHCLEAAATKKYLAEYLPSEAAERYARLVDSTRIERRFTMVPVAELLQLRGLQSRNDAYIPHAIAMGEQVAGRALDAAPARASGAMTLISLSCTGYMMPALDAHLVGRLGLPPETRRIPIMQLGCSAGVAGLGLAAEIVPNESPARVLVLSVELSSFGLQLAEPSTTDMFANLLFSDAAAAAVVSGESTGRGPEIVASRSVLLPETTTHLGMRLTDSGFRLLLSAHLPRLIHARLGSAVRDFLGVNELRIEDIAFWVVHPGGPKILDAVASGLGLPPRALAPTWDTWEAYGNLSSATVFFVLRHLAESAPPKPGALGLMLAFGPGVTCEMVLLRAGGWLSQTTS